MRRVSADVEGWLDEALKTLLDGGVVALPTETVYGLAAGIESPAGQERVCAIKGRPAEKPLPLQAASVEMALAWGFRFGDGAARLGRAFWPGPFTLVLPRPATCPLWFAPGNRALALRVPGHSVALALLKAWGRPLAVTSANRTGEPACLDGASVADLLSSEPGLFVIDAGAVSGGLPSTVVDATGGEPVILREGPIALAEILEAWHAK